MLPEGHAARWCKTAQDHGAPLRIVETVVAVNEQRKRAMARKVAAALGGNLRGKTIAVLGLTFKPNTDDMRDAPSIALITALQDLGAARARLRSGGHGAGAQRAARRRLRSRRPMSARKGADALVIVTEWDQFRALDLERLKRS